MRYPSILLSVALMSSAVLSPTANAAVYASHGKAKANLFLSRTDRDGFEKNISGSALGKLFGKNATFEVTPADKDYMTPGKGPHQKIEIPGLSYNYHESDWGYSEGWEMSATLSSMTVKTLVETVCNTHCQKINPDVQALLTSLESRTTDTYPISSRYSAYHGDTVGWSDTDGLRTTLTLDTASGEHLNLTLKFPRNWKLYDAQSD